MTSLSKKRGRPLGVKNKPAAKASSFKQVEEDVVRKLIDANLMLIQHNKDLLKQFDSFEHQIIGFRAVVSYLENRLGLESSQ